MNQIARAFAVLIFAASVTVMPAVARQHYLPQGAYTDIYALQFAARPGNSLEFRRLLADHPNLLSLIEPNGTTMLQWALSNNNYGAFQLLLKAGAKPNQPGFDGDTVIHDAAQYRDPKWLKLLLENGASPDTRNSETSAVPLVRALMSNSERPRKMLLKAGANPNLADRTGNTPLHVAAQINKPWHALELLQAGSDPMARNAQGQTFQRYLFMPNDNMVTHTIRKGRQAVREYLNINGVSVEVSAP